MTARTHRRPALRAHAAPGAQDQTRHFYDRISRAYDVIADSSEDAVRRLGIQALDVQPGERVLEIGSGTGHGLVALADAAGRSGYVCGIDNSSGMLSVAHRRIESSGGHRVRLAACDARDLCFQSGLFDAVFMSFTLEIFGEEIPRVLAEAVRVLRSEGRIGVVAMASTDEPSALGRAYRWFHRRWPQVIDCEPIDLVARLRSSGFQIAFTHVTSIWTLPVMAAVGVKVPQRAG